MKGFSLFNQIVLAIVLAAFAGVFLGEYTSYFRPIGKIYFNLLTMVTIPFAATGLIYGLGSLPLPMAKKLLRPTFYVLAFITAVSLGLVIMLSFLLPQVSTNIMVVSQEATPFSIFKSLVDLLVPSNFFSDFSRAFMPAIAIFGLIVGLTVIFVPKKEIFLNGLGTINLIIIKILAFLGVLSPIAVFAHLSEVFGSITFLQFEKIAIFLCVVAIGGLLLTFWVLPYLFGPMIGMRYSSLIKQSSEILLLVSMTSLPSLAIPKLIGILKTYEKKEENRSANVLPEKEKVILTQALPSLSFNFAQAGNLFLILFIFFTAFYFRDPLSFSEKVFAYILSVPSSWGGPISAPTTLLYFDQFFNLPELNINIYFGMHYISRIFGSLASGMGMYIFCLLVWHWHHKKIAFRPLHLCHRCAVVVLSTGIFFLLAKAGLSWISPPDNFKNHFNEITMKELTEVPNQVTIGSTHADELPAGSVRSIGSIIESKVLRVGFNIEDMPYCFLNNREEVIGYDMAFAFQLASDLECSLELIPFHYDSLIDDLLQHKFDLAMSGVIMTTDRIEKLRFSSIYTQQENVLIVAVKNLHLFSNLEETRSQANLKIAGDGAYLKLIPQYFPNAEVVTISHPDEFLTSNADAVFWSLYNARVWVYDHPDYQVVSFSGQLGNVYLAYPLAPDSYDLLAFLNDWLLLQKQSGFTELQNAFWIQGMPVASQTPRWSIIRNVLHWAK